MMLFKQIKLINILLFEVFTIYQITNTFFKSLMYEIIQLSIVQSSKLLFNLKNKQRFEITHDFNFISQNAFF